MNCSYFQEKLENIDKDHNVDVDIEDNTVPNNAKVAYQAIGGLKKGRLPFMGAEEMRLKNALGLCSTSSTPVNIENHQLQIELAEARAEISNLQSGYDELKAKVQDYDQLKAKVQDYDQLKAKVQNYDQFMMNIYPLL